jgi:iron complex transport system ATP-binding protein
MLARMLAGNTRVLVLDEPCTNLDIAHALAFLDLCRDLGHSGHTLVLAMHELELAARHADQLLCLGSDDRGGWLVGSPSEILVEGTIRTAFGVELDDRGLSFSLPRR